MKNNIEIDVVVVKNETVKVDQRYLIKTLIDDLIGSTLHSSSYVVDSGLDNIIVYKGEDSRISREYVYKTLSIDESSLYRHLTKSLALYNKIYTEDNNEVG